MRSVNRRLITLVVCMLVLLSASNFSANADQWALPKVEKYYSTDKAYYIEVTPKKLESQLAYFEDKVNGRENAGAVKGVKDNRARGAFYFRQTNGMYLQKSEFPLVNEVSPVSAIVSSRGDYFVTFDNWHSAGYGDDVVVIYRSSGEMVKKFGLSDFLTEGDIETLSRSVSSIWWGGEHYFDDSKGLLVLTIVSGSMDAKTDSRKAFAVRIDLATGRLIEPKRDLFPQPRVSSSADDRRSSELSDAGPTKTTCTSPAESFDLPETVWFPSAQIYSKANERVLPAYPVIAETAQVVGTVVVKVLVSKSGDVICVRTLSGHTLLRAAAEAASFKWKFDPIEVSGNPVNAVGTIAFNFRFTE
jgi:TonB family protein